MSKEYIVKSGDTLSNIARDNKTDVKTLTKLNSIQDANKISVGQRIVLPGGDYDEAISIAKGQLESGVTWGTAWWNVKNAVPSADNVQIDKDLNKDYWSKPGAYERFVQKDPLDLNLNLDASTAQSTPSFIPETRDESKQQEDKVEEVKAEVVKLPEPGKVEIVEPPKAGEVKIIEPQAGEVKIIEPPEEDEKVQFVTPEGRPYTPRKITPKTKPKPDKDPRGAFFDFLGVPENIKAKALEGDPKAIGNASKLAAGKLSPFTKQFFGPSLSNFRKRSVGWIGELAGGILGSKQLMKEERKKQEERYKEVPQEEAVRINDALFDVAGRDIDLSKLDPQDFYQTASGQVLIPGEISDKAETVDRTEYQREEQKRQNELSGIRKKQHDDVFELEDLRDEARNNLNLFVTGKETTDAELQEVRTKGFRERSNDVIKKYNLEGSDLTIEAVDRGATMTEDFEKLGNKIYTNITSMLDFSFKDAPDDIRNAYKDGMFDLIKDADTVKEYNDVTNELKEYDEIVYDVERDIDKAIDDETKLSDELSILKTAEIKDFYKKLETYNKDSETDKQVTENIYWNNKKSIDRVEEILPKLFELNQFLRITYLKGEQAQARQDALTKSIENFSENYAELVTTKEFNRLLTSWASAKDKDVSEIAKLISDFKTNQQWFKTNSDAIAAEAVDLETRRSAAMLELRQYEEEVSKWFDRYMSKVSDVFDRNKEIKELEQWNEIAYHEMKSEVNSAISASRVLHPFKTWDLWKEHGYKEILYEGVPKLLMGSLEGALTMSKETGLYETFDFVYPKTDGETGVEAFKKDIGFLFKDLQEVPSSMATGLRDAMEFTKWVNGKSNTLAEKIYGDFYDEKKMKEFFSGQSYSFEKSKFTNWLMFNIQEPDENSELWKDIKSDYTETVIELPKKEDESNYTFDEIMELYDSSGLQAKSGLVFTSKETLKKKLIEKSLLKENNIDPNSIPPETEIVVSLGRSNTSQYLINQDKHRKWMSGDIPYYKFKTTEESTLYDFIERKNREKVITVSMMNDFAGKGIDFEKIPAGTEIMIPNYDETPSYLSWMRPEDRLRLQARNPFRNIFYNELVANLGDPLNYVWPIAMFKFGKFVSLAGGRSTLKLTQLAKAKSPTGKISAAIAKSVGGMDNLNMLARQTKDIADWSYGMSEILRLRPVTNPKLAKLPDQTPLIELMKPRVDTSDYGNLATLSVLMAKFRGITMTKLLPSYIKRTYNEGDIAVNKLISESLMDTKQAITQIAEEYALGKRVALGRDIVKEALSLFAVSTKEAKNKVYRESSQFTRNPKTGKDYTMKDFLEAKGGKGRDRKKQMVKSLKADKEKGMFNSNAEYKVAVEDPEGFYETFYRRNKKIRAIDLTMEFMDKVGLSTVEFRSFLEKIPEVEKIVDYLDDHYISFNEHGHKRAVQHSQRYKELDTFGRMAFRELLQDPRSGELIRGPAEFASVKERLLQQFPNDHYSLKQGFKAVDKYKAEIEWVAKYQEGKVSLKGFEEDKVLIPLKADNDVALMTTSVKELPMELQKTWKEGKESVRYKVGVNKETGNLVFVANIDAYPSTGMGGVALDYGSIVPSKRLAYLYDKDIGQTHLSVRKTAIENNKQLKDYVDVDTATDTPDAASVKYGDILNTAFMDKDIGWFNTYFKDSKKKVFDKKNNRYLSEGEHFRKEFREIIMKIVGENEKTEFVSKISLKRSNLDRYDVTSSGNSNAMDMFDITDELGSQVARYLDIEKFYELVESLKSLFDRDKTGSLYRHLHAKLASKKRNFELGRLKEGLTPTEEMILLLMNVKGPDNRPDFLEGNSIIKALLSGKKLSKKELSAVTSKIKNAAWRMHNNQTNVKIQNRAQGLGESEITQMKKDVRKQIEYFGDKKLKKEQIEIKLGEEIDKMNKELPKDDAVISTKELREYDKFEAKNGNYYVGNIINRLYTYIVLKRLGPESLLDNIVKYSKEINSNAISMVGDILGRSSRYILQVVDDMTYTATKTYDNKIFAPSMEHPKTDAMDRISKAVATRHGYENDIIKEYIRHPEQMKVPETETKLASINDEIAKSMPQTVGVDDSDVLNIKQISKDTGFSEKQITELLDERTKTLGDEPMTSEHWQKKLKEARNDKGIAAQEGDLSENGAYLDAKDREALATKMIANIEAGGGYDARVVDWDRVYLSKDTSKLETKLESLQRELKEVQKLEGLEDIEGFTPSERDAKIISEEIVDIEKQIKDPTTGKLKERELTVKALDERIRKKKKEGALAIGKEKARIDKELTKEEKKFQDLLKEKESLTKDLEDLDKERKLDKHDEREIELLRKEIDQIDLSSMPEGEAKWNARKKLYGNLSKIRDLEEKGEYLSKTTRDRVKRGPAKELVERREELRKELAETPKEYYGTSKERSLLLERAKQSSKEKRKVLMEKLEKGMIPNKKHVELERKLSEISRKLDELQASNKYLPDEDKLEPGEKMIIKFADGTKKEIVNTSQKISSPSKAIRKELGKKYDFDENSLYYRLRKLRDHINKKKGIDRWVSVGDEVTQEFLDDMAAVDLAMNLKRIEAGEYKNTVFADEATLAKATDLEMDLAEKEKKWFKHKGMLEKMKLDRSNMIAKGDGTAALTKKIKSEEKVGSKLLKKYEEARNRGDTFANAVGVGEMYGQDGKFRMHRRYNRNWNSIDSWEYKTGQTIITKNVIDMFNQVKARYLDNEKPNPNFGKTIILDDYTDYGKGVIEFLRSHPNHFIEDRDFMVYKIDDAVDGLVNETIIKEAIRSTELKPLSVLMDKDAGWALTDDDMLELMDLSFTWKQFDEEAQQIFKKDRYKYDMFTKQGSEIEKEQLRKFAAKLEVIFRRIGKEDGDHRRNMIWDNATTDKDSLNRAARRSDLESVSDVGEDTGAAGRASEESEGRQRITTLSEKAKNAEELQALEGDLMSDIEDIKFDGKKYTNTYKTMPGPRDEFALSMAGFFDSVKKAMGWVELSKIDKKKWEVNSVRTLEPLAMVQSKMIGAANGNYFKNGNLLPSVEQSLGHQRDVITGTAKGMLETLPILYGASEASSFADFKKANRARLEGDASRVRRLEKNIKEMDSAYIEKTEELRIMVDNAQKKATMLRNKLLMKREYKGQELPNLEAEIKFLMYESQLKDIKALRIKFEKRINHINKILSDKNISPGLRETLKAERPTVIDNLSKLKVKLARYNLSKINMEEFGAFPGKNIGGLQKELGRLTMSDADRKKIQTRIDKVKEIRNIIDDLEERTAIFTTRDNKGTLDHEDVLHQNKIARAERYIARIKSQEKLALSVDKILSGIFKPDKDVDVDILKFSKEFADDINYRLQEIRKTERKIRNKLNKVKNVTDDYLIVRRLRQELAELDRERTKLTGFIDIAVPWNIAMDKGIRFTPKEIYRASDGVYQQSYIDKINEISKIMRHDRTGKMASIELKAMDVLGIRLGTNVVGGVPEGTIKPLTKDWFKDYFFNLDRKRPDEITLPRVDWQDLYDIDLDKRDDAIAKLLEFYEKTKTQHRHPVIVDMSGNLEVFFRKNIKDSRVLLMHDKFKIVKDPMFMDNLESVIPGRNVHLTKGELKAIVELKEMMLERQGVWLFGENSHGVRARDLADSFVDKALSKEEILALRELRKVHKRKVELFQPSDDIKFLPQLLARGIRNSVMKLIGADRKGFITRNTVGANLDHIFNLANRFSTQNRIARMLSEANISIKEADRKLRRSTERTGKVFVMGGHEKVITDNARKALDHGVELGLKFYFADVMTPAEEVMFSYLKQVVAKNGNKAKIAAKRYKMDNKLKLGSKDKPDLVLFNNKKTIMADTSKDSHVKYRKLITEKYDKPDADPLWHDDQLNEFQSLDVLSADIERELIDEVQKRFKDPNKYAPKIVKEDIELGIDAEDVYAKWIAVTKKDVLKDDINEKVEQGIRKFREDSIRQFEERYGRKPTKFELDFVESEVQRAKFVGRLLNDYVFKFDMPERIASQLRRAVTERAVYWASVYDESQIELSKKLFYEDLENFMKFSKASGLTYSKYIGKLKTFWIWNVLLLRPSWYLWNNLGDSVRAAFGARDAMLVKDLQKGFAVSTSKYMRKMLREVTRDLDANLLTKNIGKFLKKQVPGEKIDVFDFVKLSPKEVQRKLKKLGVDMKERRDIAIKIGKINKFKEYKVFDLVDEPELRFIKSERVDEILRFKFTDTGEVDPITGKPIKIARTKRGELITDRDLEWMTSSGLVQATTDPTYARRIIDSMPENTWWEKVRKRGRVIRGDVEMYASQTEEIRRQTMAFNVLFDRSIEKAMTIAQAEKQIKRYMFDYRDMTYAGRTFRNLFPFYTFHAKSLQLYFSLLLKAGPGVVQAGKALLDAMEEETAHLPEYMRERVKLDIPGFGEIWFLPHFGVADHVKMLLNPYDTFVGMLNNPLKAIGGLGWGPFYSSFIQTATGEGFFERVYTVDQLKEKGWNMNEINDYFRKMEKKKKVDNNKFGAWVMNYAQSLFPLANVMSSVLAGDQQSLVRSTAWHQSKRVRELFKFFGFNLLTLDDIAIVWDKVNNLPPGLVDVYKKRLEDEDPRLWTFFNDYGVQSALKKISEMSDDEVKLEYGVDRAGAFTVRKYYDMESWRKGSGQTWMANNPEVEATMTKYWDTVLDKEVREAGFLTFEENNVKRLVNEILSGLGTVGADKLAALNVLGIKNPYSKALDKQALYKALYREDGTLRFKTMEEIVKVFEDFGVMNEVAEITRVKEVSVKTYNDWRKLSVRAKEDKRDDDARYYNARAVISKILPSNIDTMPDAEANKYWERWRELKKLLIEDNPEFKARYKKDTPEYQLEYEKTMSLYNDKWDKIINGKEGKEKYYETFYAEPEWFQNLFFLKHPGKKIYYPIAREYNKQIQALVKEREETGEWDAKGHYEALDFVWQNKKALELWDKAKPGIYNFTDKHRQIWKELSEEEINDEDRKNYYDIFYQNEGDKDWDDYREYYFKKEGNEYKRKLYPFMRKWTNLLDRDDKKDTALAMDYFWSPSNAEARKLYGENNPLEDGKNKLDYQRQWKDWSPKIEEDLGIVYDLVLESDSWFQNEYWRKHPEREIYYPLAFKINEMEFTEGLQEFFKPENKAIREAWEKDKPGTKANKAFWLEHNLIVQKDGRKSALDFYFDQKNANQIAKHEKNNPGANYAYRLWQMFEQLPRDSWLGRKKRREFLRENSELKDWWGRNKELTGEEKTVILKEEIYYTILDRVNAEGKGRQYYLDFYKARAEAEQYLKDNPDLAEARDNREYAEGTAADKAIRKLIDEYFRLSLQEDKTEFLEKHPEVDTYLQNSVPPGIKNVRDTQSDYFDIEYEDEDKQRDERQTFLANHPELVEYWDIKNLPTSYYTDKAKFEKTQTIFNKANDYFNAVKNGDWETAEKVRNKFPVNMPDLRTEEGRWLLSKLYREAMSTWASTFGSYMSTYYFRSLPSWLRNEYYRRNKDAKIISYTPMSRSLNNAVAIENSKHPDLNWARSMMNKYGKDMPSSISKQVTKIMTKWGEWEERSNWSSRQWSEWREARTARLNSLRAHDLQYLPLLRKELARANKMFSYSMLPIRGSRKYGVINPFLGSPVLLPELTVDLENDIIKNN